MTNSIWKTDNLQEADTRKQVLFCAGGSGFPYLGWHYPNKGFGTWNYEDVQKWCYLDDLIATADRAERLQKAVDSALEGIQYIMDYGYTDPSGHYEDLQSLYNKIKQLIKDE